MKLQELLMIIETYGGDVRRWPVEKRVEAEKLLWVSREVQSALSEAMKLDSLLDRYVVPEADDQLLHKIVSGNTQTRNKNIMSYIFNPSLALTVLVFCLVFGFMVGFFEDFTTVQSLSQTESATLLLGPVEIGVI